MTELRVDVTAATPVYEQIRAQLAALVAVGALGAGERLPASRDLARDLGVAVGTVQRAYRELEAAGVVHSRRRTGTVVADGAARPAAAGAGGTGAAGGGDLLADVRALVGRGRAEGLDDAELLLLVRGVQAETRVGG
ncbi:GntR family transcriptional regulator [Cellulomonas sp.]|uniref:GntR family transcriptional regulator n=1 Tax=Cellulomonas sp. TaxID=40001 RepID=UPI002D26AB76|nr:GntR family transcriptional regulator [Cellulomonas sp.]HYQ73839.1 GntR family transcriptional regulator [Cellulomonas sp.]